MQPPPRDPDTGEVTPHDHPEIMGADGIVRRISERLVVPDGKGGQRLSSMAFKASSGGPYAGMSVDLEVLISTSGQDIATYVTTPRWTGSVRFTAGELRQETLMVGFDPIAGSDGDPGNPFHGQVWGEFSKSRIRKLAELARWLVPIPGVSIL